MGTCETCLLGNGKSTLEMWVEMLGQEIRMMENQPTRDLVISEPKSGKQVSGKTMTDHYLSK